MFDEYNALQDRRGAIRDKRDKTSRYRCGNSEKGSWGLKRVEKGDRSKILSIAFLRRMQWAVSIQRESTSFSTKVNDDFQESKNRLKTRRFKFPSAIISIQSQTLVSQRTRHADPQVHLNALSLACALSHKPLTIHSR